MPSFLSVAVHTPAHSRLGSLLTYQSESALAPGSLVRVPLGKRETLGVVWGEADASESPEKSPATAAANPTVIRSVTSMLGAVAPLSDAWRQLMAFTASYYQRSLGEVALAALPPQLRELSMEQLARRLKRQAGSETPVTAAPGTTESIALSEEQISALADIEAQNGPFVLFGATGSGKTEVFLHAVQALFERDPDAQALVMVPEINLTPQLEARFTERFAPRYGAASVVALHSGMTNPQRLTSWLSAHLGPALGGARIVLGTRMAVFASMPRLRLIVVDEEHDPSYKSQDGARYSARDLAVYRGRLEGAKVILGSATPSLESWHHSRPLAEGGRYVRINMPSRIGANAGGSPHPNPLPGGEGINTGTGLPAVRLVNMALQPPRTVFSAPLLEAITQRIARGEQAMVFLNRRGYAPVLHCTACGWKSECPHCSAHRVFHKIDRTLRCHHCGLTERVPRACPDCGNVDISPVGRGTEQIEEQLTALFAAVQRPDGGPVRVARIDADSTRLKGELGRQLAEVHAGEVDLLVGTQMIAKGHDFRRITLVAAINPDGALFSSDFRAPERLFSLLMQAAGRAGRSASQATSSEMWIQTGFPTHAMFQALKKHDYPSFAAQELEERQRAGMPPYSYQALVRAEARSQEVAQSFLATASAAAEVLEGAAQVVRYPAVPMTIQRIANVERAQMLIESHSRVALQRFMGAWHGVLHATRSTPEHKTLIRWAVDVDPLAI